MRETVGSGETEWTFQQPPGVSAGSDHGMNIGADKQPRGLQVEPQMLSMLVLERQN